METIGIILCAFMVPLLFVFAVAVIVGMCCSDEGDIDD